MYPGVVAPFEALQGDAAGECDRGAKELDGVGELPGGGGKLAPEPLISVAVQVNLLAVQAAQLGDLRRKLVTFKFCF